MATVSVNADRRVLSVFALFDSVYGQDFENGPNMTDARLMVRDYCKEVLRTVPSSHISRWMEFRVEHPHHIWAYLCFALTRSSEHWQTESLALDAIPDGIVRTTLRSLDGLDNVLADFDKDISISALFGRLQPLWNRAIRQYNLHSIENDLRIVHQLLGPESTAKAPKEVHVVPTPFDSHFSAYAAPLGRVFYTLDGPGTTGGGLNTHEYLHVFVNPIEFTALSDHARTAFKEACSKPEVRDNYGDLHSFLHECMVRALCLLLADNPHEREDLMSNDLNAGLLLVEPFYQALHSRTRSLNDDYGSVLKEIVEVC